MLGRLLVTGQLMLLALLAALPWLPGGDGFDQPIVGLVGYGLAVAGAVVVIVAAAHLGEALTASPVPKTGAGLRTGGLYRFVRHPIYAGVLLLGWGLGLRAERWLGVVLAVLLTGVLSWKARYEERLLAAAHTGYADYAAGTPRFVPRLPRTGRGR